MLLQGQEAQNTRSKDITEKAKTWLNQQCDGLLKKINALISSTTQNVLKDHKTKLGMVTVKKNIFTASNKVNNILEETGVSLLQPTRF